MTNRAPVRTIAILGAGIVGLSAAIAFARALPGLAITLIDTPGDPAALADRMPGTLPSISDFHDRIGLAETDVLAAGATHRIATRLVGWREDDRAFVRAHGECGGPVGDGAFHQHWLNAHRAGKVAPFDTFSPAAVLGIANRFVPPSADPASPLSGFGYALRLDPPRYRALLASYGRHLGISPVAGRYAGVERRADGGVATLLLADDRRVAADLYLDCSGPAASLRSALDTDWECWRAALPVDRLRIGTGPAQAPTPTDTLAALASGWRIDMPLRDRTLIAFAYTAACTADADVARVLPAGEKVAIRPGIRRQPWAHNVLAIGDAAVVLDPLAEANLHLAHAAIMRAIDLLPGRDCAASELAEYNIASYRQAARVRDFQAAHYAATRRTRGPFWTATRHLAPPSSLAHTLTQFAHRGRLPFQEQESFDDDDWRGLLLGLGMIPRLADPIASAVPLATVRATLAQMADSIATLPQRLPPYPAYLAQLERRR